MFRLIHTADWHIGKSFGGLPPDKQGVLRDARLTAVDRIAETARKSGAAHILVAGDVFDSGSLPARQVSHLLERLRAQAGLAWHLLPGNHDADRPGGLYDRLTRTGLPDNVHVCRAAEVLTLAPGVALLPAPAKMQASSGDPTAWMASAVTPPGTLRIGLAHGSVRDFGSSSEATARIVPERAREAGLAYLALGDWHGTKEVAPAVWYSGTPEPDRYLDNAAGQVLSVVLGGNRSGLDVKAIPTGRFAWYAASLTPRSADEIGAFERTLAETVGGLDRLLARIDVKGQVPLAAHAAVLARLFRLEEQLFHLELDRDAFTVLPDGDDLTALGKGNDLERAARRLMALRDDTSSGAAARRALEILFRLAAERRS
jgi:DNA repair exonuclease SbcCD nuclease subunit